MASRSMWPKYGTHTKQLQGPLRNFTLVTFDASLSGGGATLQAGLRALEEAATRLVVSYWHATWSDEDLATVRAKKGEASGQAVHEAYALLISVAM